MKVSGAGVKEEQGLLGAEAQKVRLQMLITHFFREIMAGAPADSADKIEPNDAAGRGAGTVCVCLSGLAGALRVWGWVVGGEVEGWRGVCGCGCGCGWKARWL